MKNSFFFGKKITQLYVQSVFIKDELNDEFNVIFLKIEDWFEIVLNEGKLKIQKLDEVVLLPLDEIVDDFKYPIRDYTNDYRFKSIVNCIITNFALLKYNDGDDFFGIKILFNNTDQLIYYEDLKNEKCILITDKIMIPNNIDYIEYNYFSSI